LAARPGSSTTAKVPGVAARSQFAEEPFWKSSQNQSVPLQTATVLPPEDELEELLELEEEEELEPPLDEPELLLELELPLEPLSTELELSPPPLPPPQAANSPAAANMLTSIALRKPFMTCSFSSELRL